MIQKINTKRGGYLLQSTTKKHKHMLMKQVSYVNSNATDTYPLFRSPESGTRFNCDRKIFNCSQRSLAASFICLPSDHFEHSDYPLNKGSIQQKTIAFLRELKYNTYFLFCQGGYHVFGKIGKSKTWKALYYKDFQAFWKFPKKFCLGDCKRKNRYCGVVIHALIAANIFIYP